MEKISILKTHYVGRWERLFFVGFSPARLVFFGTAGSGFLGVDLNDGVMIERRVILQIATYLSNQPRHHHSHLQLHRLLHD